MIEACSSTHHDPPVAVGDPVAHLQRLAEAPVAVEMAGHLGHIVRVHQLVPQALVAHEVRRRIAAHLFDLWTQVHGPVVLVGRVRIDHVDVDDRGDPLDQRAIAGLRLGEAFGRRAGIRDRARGSAMRMVLAVGALGRLPQELLALQDEDVLADGDEDDREDDGAGLELLQLG